MNEKEKQKVKIFLNYAKEDIDFAKKIYNHMNNKGIDVWLDEFSLRPGQKWKTEIKKAINESQYFLALLSSKSVTKQGYVQKELKEALEILDEMPESQIFILPMRIDECEPSHHAINELHWVDLFPSWNDGIQKVVETILINENFDIDEKKNISYNRNHIKILIMSLLSALTWGICGSIYLFLFKYDKRINFIPPLFIAGIIQALLIRSITPISKKKIILSGFGWLVGTVSGVLSGMIILLAIHVIIVGPFNALWNQGEYKSIEYLEQIIMPAFGGLLGGFVQLLLIKENIIFESKQVLKIFLLANTGWFVAGAMHGILDIFLGLSASDIFSTINNSKDTIANNRAISLSFGGFFYGFIGSYMMFYVLYPKFKKIIV